MLSREVMMLLFWLPDPPPNELHARFDRDILVSLILNNLSAHISDKKSQDAVKLVATQLLKSASLHSEIGG